MSIGSKKKMSSAAEIRGERKRGLKKKKGKDGGMVPKRVQVKDLSFHGEGGKPKMKEKAIRLKDTDSKEGKGKTEGGRLWEG